MSATPSATALAKAALRRLAQEQAEPTPENYGRAYALEAGMPEPPAAARSAAHASEPVEAAWADLLERVVKQVDRSTKLWTPARRKDSLQRIFESSRQNPNRLQQRLSQLLSSWENNREEDSAQGPSTDLGALLPTQPAPLDEIAKSTVPAPSLTFRAAGDAEPAPGHDWPRIVELLANTVTTALPATQMRAQEAAQELQRVSAQVTLQSPAPWWSEFSQACANAQRVIEHRNHLTQQITLLCCSLTDGLSDLAEDESWTQGQALAMREQLKSGINARGIRRIHDLLETTRQRQAQLRSEHLQARQALKALIHQMLSEIGQLGAHTDRFQNSLGRYAETIGKAESLESLTGVVREMVAESRAVHTLVAQTQERLQNEHAKATDLSAKVKSLEDEIRRLSDEVSTDPLTQVANRRGLMRTFDQELARIARDGGALALALLDIDNFKKLNDTLGHQTGDEALKFLTQRVQKSLRPSDTLARYGGEEFVVLLPNTILEEAQIALTRLQRELSAELFMHEDKQTFVTFSAGLTLLREGESLESALDRADEALYEAKRTGKNRTCIA